MGFLDPAPHGGTVGVVYAPTDPASRADAEAIISLFGAGLASGGGVVTAKAVSSAALGDGAGLIAVILATGAGEGGASAVARLHGMLCITAVEELVQSGHCIMAVHSQPRVEITINRAAAQTAGVSFTPAFSMLVHEL